MYRKIIFAISIFLLMSFFCAAQKNEVYDSALINKKTEQIIGNWYYSNKEKDTFVIRIDKIPIKQLLHKQAEFYFNTAIVWVYYKKGGIVLDSGIKKYAPDKYNNTNWTLSGSYIDYRKSFVLTYTDKNLGSVCMVKLVRLSKRKLLWEVKYDIERENKRHNFFYPEKLVLRRMKKHLL
jgi:hypothetical protein